jgi:hypothetical protein
VREAVGKTALSYLGQRGQGTAADPILVTGMHRSGTSWLGEMLSAGGQLLNIQEPLSAQNRQTILRRRARHWYSYISSANEGEYLPWYGDALRYRIHPVHDIKRARLVSPRDPFRIVGKWVRVTGARRMRQRILFKDPFAVFSATWFTSRLHCRVVVSIRHPAAVVSSLKKLGYRFDFRDLLDQESLMRDHLEPFRADMEAACEDPDDVVGQGCLLWRVIYGFVASHAAHDDNALLVRHEDLSSDPITRYAELYDRLGLDLNEAAYRTISHYTSEQNPREVALRRYGSVPLNSRASIYSWRKRLTSDEIERVRRETQDVCAEFYAERDWDVPADSRT